MALKITDKLIRPFRPGAAGNLCFAPEAEAKTAAHLSSGAADARAAAEKNTAGTSIRTGGTGKNTRVGLALMDPRSPGAALPFSGVKVFYFFMFALLFLALYLTFLLIQPFLHTIILACIFTALSHPLYRKIYLHFWENGWLAAGLTLFLLVFLVCLPLIFFIVQLLPQATQSIAALAGWLSGAHLDTLVNEKVYPFLNWLNNELTWMNLDVADMRASLLSVSRQAGQMMLTWGTDLVVDSLTMFANFLLMLLIMFFLLKDGEYMLGSLRRLSPLRAEQGDRIISNLRRMAKGVLLGGFMVAALQGLVGGIGLAIVGIPALFWGTVMAFAALVPVLGTALVWIPAVVYLLLNNQTSSALLLLGWCAILVTSIDSILRPIIIRGNAKTSLLFLFIAVIGGIKAFGVLGIVYGPLILSFVGVMLAIYSDEYRHSLTSGNEPLSPNRRTPPRRKAAPRRKIVRSVN